MDFLQETSFTVKSDLNGDMRRFTFEASEGMAALQQKLATIYDAGELTLKCVAILLLPIVLAFLRFQTLA